MILPKGSESRHGASRIQRNERSVPGAPFSQRRAVLAGLIILVVVLGTVAVYQQQDISALTRAATDPRGVLEFDASMNATVISPNQTIRVEVSDMSNQSFMVQLPYASGNLGNFSMGPCADYPFGVALYQGMYTLDNWTTAGPSIFFYKPGAYLCGSEIAYYPSYQFSPLQNVSGTVDISGYWTGGLSQSVHHPFLHGVYTLEAVDAWGDIILLHFQVSGNDSNNSDG